MKVKRPHIKQTLLAALPAVSSAICIPISFLSGAMISLGNTTLTTIALGLIGAELVTARFNIAAAHQSLTTEKPLSKQRLLIGCAVPPLILAFGFIASRPLIVKIQQEQPEAIERAAETTRLRPQMQPSPLSLRPD